MRWGSHISGDEFMALLYRHERKRSGKLSGRHRKRRKKRYLNFRTAPRKTSGPPAVLRGIRRIPRLCPSCAATRTFPYIRPGNPNAERSVSLIPSSVIRTIWANGGRAGTDSCGEKPAVRPAFGDFSGDRQLAADTAPIVPKSGVLITRGLQGKLYQVEQMNWRTAFFAFSSCCRRFPGTAGC